MFRNINIRDIVNEAVASGGIIVDVRNRESFAKGHIPLAVNVPLDEIKAGRVSLPKRKEVITYCETGGSSAIAANYLTNMGYKVVNTIGGLKMYRGPLTNSRYNQVDTGKLYK